MRKATSLAWRRTPRPMLNNARVTRSLRVVTLVLVLFFAYQLYTLPSTFHVHRQALLQKYRPTVYSFKTADEQGKLEEPRWRWDKEQNDAAQKSSYSRVALWEERHAWTKLGSGFEGKTFKHGNVVIKKYRANNAPFRDCVPGSKDGLRWPTEIPAQLVVSGVADSDTIPLNASFLPTVDYFLGPDSQPSKPEWYLVTPLLPSGNLEHLSRQLRASRHRHTAREVDDIFRPSLEHILDVLDYMHTSANLCHDDVKMDNILSTVPDAPGTDTTDPELKTHWLLGDLGNAREPAHEYHSSILWWKLNNNLRDCRGNDVLRLLKTYIKFLRDSVVDVTEFDEHFLQRRESWSSLFWQVYQDAEEGRTITATGVRKQSQAQGRAEGVSPVRGSLEPAPSWNPLYNIFVGRAWTMARAVAEAVRISARENVARRWGFAWLLGVPVPGCHGGGNGLAAARVDGNGMFLD
ncbi:hypothetical protein B0I35DRAFT_482330 [Stachybotrys elegans]|uniref:Protein kinase domain-containing protein n=1 Tax=Stachybotrys elegans TaxID=80388 RepID=A0A8K0WMG9_9HYPO|nr:hypothetical protein B0I35DRAFT_482330 [Stachybotrys elegans]